MRRFPYAERLIFYLLLAFQLVPLWSVKYFLTIDGPCHLHNARVLADFSKNEALYTFYNSWLTLNPLLEPNWFGHFFMKTLFAAGVPGFLNEKLLQTFYVLAFGLGLRFVIRQLNPGGLVFSSLGLLFTYHHVFQMGFYNYCCSVALLFWAFGYWLRCEGVWTPGRQLGLAALFLALYFCHPIGLLFTFLLIGAGVVLRRRRGAALRQEAATLLLAALPALVLFAAYLFAKGLSFRPTGDTVRQLGLELAKLSALCTTMNVERSWAPVVSVACAALLGFALFLKIKNRSWQRGDVLFGFFLLTLLIYFKQPGSFAGGGILSVRLQTLPYLMLLLWLATVEFPAWLPRAVLAFAVAMFVVFWSIRLPSHWRASEAVAEYAGCAAAVPDRVSVLPLSFNHHGQTASDEEVSSATWLFVHAAGYIGAERNIVLLDNYEAHTRNFPLLWREHCNPFVLLPVEDVGFEGQPPRADFLHFPEKAAGARVDYVVTWCLEKKFADHAFSREILAQLNEGYELVYRSPHDLGRVYRARR